MTHALVRHPVTPLVRGLTGSLVLGLAVTLHGCGDGPEDQELTNRELTTLAPDASVSAPAASARRPARDEPGLTALRAARETVPGGTVNELERKGEQWQVTFVRPDGREVLVEVDPGDPPVVRRLGVDTDDRAEDRLRVQASRLRLGQALSRARTMVPTATLAKIELDVDDGVLVWELDFDDEDDVLVDARTGAISRED